MILFTTHMFIGGFFGFVLDNTIPGKSKKCMTVGHVNLQVHVVVKRSVYDSFPLFGSHMKVIIQYKYKSVYIMANALEGAVCNIDR